MSRPSRSRIDAPVSISGGNSAGVDCGVLDDLIASVPFGLLVFHSWPRASAPCCDSRLRMVPTSCFVSSGDTLGSPRLHMQEAAARPLWTSVMHPLSSRLYGLFFCRFRRLFAAEPCRSSVLHLWSHSASGPILHRERLIRSGSVSAFCAGKPAPPPIVSTHHGPRNIQVGSEDRDPPLKADPSILVIEVAF